MIISFILLLSLRLVFAGIPTRRSYDTHNYYVLHHDPTTPSGASLADVTKALDVELVEQAGELQDYWVVRQAKPTGDLHVRDQPDRVLSTYEALKARANSPIETRSQDTHFSRRIVSSVDYLTLQKLRKRVKRAPPPITPDTEPSSVGVASRFDIKDPLFSKQWHLVNNEFPQHMMNVSGIWAEGFTGKGVISSLVDDGLDYTSEDLAANFDEADSYDFNDHEPLPTPKNFDDHHGTRCAGQIAAEKNDVCGVGIAYNSKVAGVRILSGPITDLDEAAALNYGFQNVSIYSCSWGPPDNGQSMEGPNYLIQKAVVNGINHGRGGKGSIFVFASGNGAAQGDQCNFDGYTNSIYSVTVSAVDYKGLHPYYSEPCAANMIVAYSSGSGHHIVTTDKGSKGKTACASTHGGTSAAAPNAVGVFALTLEARPDLTWRDIQYLCVENAAMINEDDPDWETTAAGRKYSYKYGYGVLDGYKYFKAAQEWKLVKPQSWLRTKTIQHNNGTYGSERKFSGGDFIPPTGIESKLTITKELMEENNLESLEHINVRVWIDHAARGDVEVEIVSPNNITSVLGAARPSDRSGDGYPGWMFMSVKHWGENPIGDWTLKVRDQNNINSNGTFLGWNMILWGTSIDPAKATKWEVPVIDDILPPVEAPLRPVISGPTASTKLLPKPTDHLPGDHGEASGEKNKPAFSTPVDDAVIPSSTETTATSTTPTESAKITSTPDLGWFTDMSSLVTGQKWFFIVLGAVSLFGIGAGIFFWRRRMVATQYAPLGEENGVSMAAVGTATSGSRTTRELYDAFGEVSDDEDDETTALHPPNSRALGFNSGFLEDDDPSTAAGLTPMYRDEPEGGGLHEQHSPAQVSGAPSSERGTSSPAESGDSGSWEHASRE